MLVDTGYMRSGRGDRIVDGTGNPLPWYTFSAIGYLDSLDLHGARVLEFGSGSSTRYWEQRGGTVVAVEHNVEWYRRMRPSLSPRTNYILATDEETYVAPVDADQRFDVIVIDGIHRRRCVESALRFRAEGGIVVLDNSDWMPELAARLRSGGLIQVDLAGFGPLLSHAWTTSVFLDGQHPPAHVRGAPHIPLGASSFSKEMRHLVATKPETFGPLV